MSYFVSTCRTREAHKDKHLANFEEDFGNVTCKEINRPSICHFLCEFLRIMHKHNRIRQDFFGLEMK